MKLVCALVLAAAAAIPDGTWLLAYGGKPIAAAVSDKRMLPVVRNRLPVALVGRVFGTLGDARTPVAVADDRFVAMTGCGASGCRLRALLWIDAKGTSALGAAYEVSAGEERLTIGSNGLSPNDLPPAAMTSVVAWLRANGLDPDVVEFMGPSSVPRRVDPVPFRASR
jgi:hypothetical protein